MNVGTNVNACGSQNQKTKMNPILKGGIIGGSIGGGIRGLVEFGNYKYLKSCTKLTKDEFLKRTLDKCKGESQSTIDYVKRSIDSEYESFLQTAKSSFDKVKKGIPERLWTSVGIVAGIGAAIGLIVHLVKSNKAKKEQA